jgi:hypothetical protein
MVRPSHAEGAPFEEDVKFFRPSNPATRLYASTEPSFSCAPQCQDGLSLLRFNDLWRLSPGVKPHHAPARAFWGSDRTSRNLLIPEFRLAVSRLPDELPNQHLRRGTCLSDSTVGLSFGTVEPLCAVKPSGCLASCSQSNPRRHPSAMMSVGAADRSGALKPRRVAACHVARLTLGRSSSCGN